MMTNSSKVKNICNNMTQCLVLFYADFFPNLLQYMLTKYILYSECFHNVYKRNVCDKNNDVFLIIKPLYLSVQ